jgi:hypothetical protein
VAKSLLVCLLVLGCEGSGTPGGGRGGDAGADAAVVPLLGMSAAVGEAICGKRYACCSPDEIAQEQFSSDAAGCKRGLDNFFVLTMPELEASIATGRVAYDGAALGRCLAAYSGMTCAAARAGVPPAISLTGCPYLVPLLALGATCGQGFECRDGYCQGVTLTSEGICAPKKPDGEFCQTLDECVSGNCDPDSELCAPLEPRSVCVGAR